MRLAVHKIYKAPKPKGIDEREIKKNFSIFEALHEHSKNVVEAFKASQTPGYVKMGGVELTPVFALASVFAQFVAEFKVFISYIQIQYWAQKWYMKYRNDKVHSDWFQVRVSNRGGGWQ